MKGKTQVLAEWVGVKITQVRCEAPEYQKFVGRRGTVDNAIIDEWGQTHIRTEDGVWCPARLCIRL